MKKLILLISTIILVFIIGELICRKFLKDYPEDYISIFTDFYQKSKDPLLSFEQKPDWSGYATGIKIKINKYGLRDQLKNFSQKKRVLLIGDSMFFGFGLKYNNIISERMEDLFKKNDYNIEVINAGVCGYNLRQNFQNLKKYYKIFKPDYVLISFIHNDLEGLKNKYDSKIPELLSYYYNNVRENKTLFKVYNFFVNEDLLRHKRFQKSFRYFLLHHSKLYLFCMLKLKKIMLQSTGGVRPSPYLKYHSNSIAVQKIMFEPFNNILKEFKYFTDENDIKYDLLILNNQNLSGQVETKIYNILKKNKINFYTFVPFIPNLKEYFKNYTLGWDPHPNSKGAELYAKLMVDVLNENKFIKIKNDYIFSKTKHNDYLNNLDKNPEIKLTDNLLKTSINFKRFENYKNYPLWGIWDFTNTQKSYFINNQEQGRLVSKFLSVILKRTNQKYLAISGRNVNPEPLKLKIQIKNKYFLRNINPLTDFDLKIDISNIKNYKQLGLEIFIESYNKNIDEKPKKYYFLIKNISVENIGNIKE